MANSEGDFLRSIHKIKIQLPVSNYRITKIFYLIEINKINKPIGIEELKYNKPILSETHVQQK